MFATYYRLLALRGTLVLAFATIASPARAILIVNYSSIVPLGPAIQFDEIPYGTANPVYHIGPSTGGVNVAFGSHFAGQTLGATPNTLSDKTPDSPLTLAMSSPVGTSIDLAQGSVALGGKGAGFFTTPISMRFDQPVAAVGFRTGHFDVANSILFEAFNGLGESLGIVRNPSSGVSNFGIRTDTNRNQISGLSIYMLPGTMDWEGYTIDNLIVNRVVVIEEENVSSTPEPSGQLAAVLAAAAALRKRHKTTVSILTNM